MNSMEIYDKVNRMRKDKGLTIYALSNQAEVSHSLFYSWRKRKTMPSIEVLEKISDALGTSLSKLLFSLESNELSEEQKQVMELWSVLNREQKNAALAMLKTMAKG